VQFVADENVEREVVERLRQEGLICSVEMTRGIKRCLPSPIRSGITDADKRFGELIFRQQPAALGVVLLRFSAAISPQQKG